MKRCRVHFPTVENHNGCGIAFYPPVIKKCVQRRTIATITNERGSEGALCNQRDLYETTVDVPPSPGLLAEGNCDNSELQTDNQKRARNRDRCPGNLGDILCT